MHTPGPWRTGRWGARCTVESDAGQVCGVSKRTTEEADANLIAAAPDMLRELKSILEWAVYEHSPLMPAEIASIKATIAKAEGRS
jgi:hypothetical protein